MRSVAGERRAFTAGLLTGATLAGVAILAAGAGRRALRRREERRRSRSLVEEGRIIIDGARPPDEAELEARPLEETPREPLESEATWDVSPKSERW
jgi:hypothetical protein